MTDSKYTCRVKQITQLAITRHGGTMFVTVDTFKGQGDSRVNGGTIQISGYFGPWAYTWTHVGEGSFIDFLGELNFEYAMNKLVGRQDLYEFDLDRTLERVKSRIIELRVVNDLQREQAREYWDELENIEPTTEREFFDALNDIYWCDGYESFVSLFSALYDDDISEVPVLTSPKGNMVYFWENLWPIILVELRKALESQEIAA